MKAKHFSLLSGALLLMLGSCSSDVVLESQTDTRVPITYNIDSSNHSRAAEIFSSTNLPDEFYVWAYDYNNNKKVYIDGHRIYKNDEGNYVDADGPVFWPSGVEELQFFAITDNTNVPSVANGGICMTLNYTLSNNVSEQKDLMVSHCTAKKSDNGQISFAFKHALSQIAFKIENKNTDISLTINSLALGQIAANSKMTFQGGINNISWEQVSSPSGSFELPAKNFTITSESPWQSDIANTAMFIPQIKRNVNSVLPGFGDEPTEEPTIPSYEYLKINLTAKSAADGSQIADPKDYYVELADGWAAGYKYNYNIIFPENWVPDGAIPFTYTVSASNFDDGTTSTTQVK